MQYFLVVVVGSYVNYDSRSQVKWLYCSKGETVRINHLLNQVVLQIYSSIVDKHGNLFKI